MKRARNCSGQSTCDCWQDKLNFRYIFEIIHESNKRAPEIEPEAPAWSFWVQISTFGVKFHTVTFEVLAGFWNDACENYHVKVVKIYEGSNNSLISNSRREQSKSRFCSPKNPFWQAAKQILNL